jgi:hypothetical protein
MWASHVHCCEPGSLLCTIQIMQLLYKLKNFAESWYVVLTELWGACPLWCTVHIV